MRFLFFLIITFQLSAIEPFVPAEERRNYERVRELKDTKPNEALELISSMNRTHRFLITLQVGY